MGVQGRMLATASLMNTGRTREIRKLDKIAAQSSQAKIVRRRGDTETVVKAKVRLTRPAETRVKPTVEIRKLKVENAKIKVELARSEAVEWSRSFFDKLDRLDSTRQIQTADID